MAGGGSEENDLSLKYTPTWVIAVVCSVIVLISLVVERSFHFIGRYLKKKNKIPLYEALQKVKEELMLLGFISFLMTVFQNLIVKFCVSENLTRRFLPCKYKEDHYKLKTPSAPFGRHLLAKYRTTCADEGKVPLLPLKALHHLHIFIFVLAIVHVTICALTIFFGGVKLRQWKHWEDSIAKDKYDTAKVLNKITPMHQHSFIRDRFRGIVKSSALLGWLHAFVKQFYASVTKSDYIILRLGFTMTHCRGNPKFNFHMYMIRALEADFKKVVGISWFLWIFVVIFLLLNVDDRNAYFWIAFIPLILLLAVGTKLEHVITQIVHDVAKKHVAIEGELVFQPSDDYFWFNRPRMVLFLIHFILFQNAFEIAFFFWVLVQYGFDSCIMGKVGYIVPRLVISVFIQVLCSYSTLPLYAIVTQMGTSFKKEMFEEHVQAGLLDWVKRARKKQGLREVANESSHMSSKEVSNGIQLGELSQKPSAMGEEGSSDRIESVQT